MNEKKSLNWIKQLNKKKIAVVSSFVLLIIVFLSFSLYVLVQKLTQEPQPLSIEQQISYEQFLASHRLVQTISPLPYKTIPAKLSVNAKSLVLIDEANGSILFEKNADLLIPPASLTKLMVMYIALQEVNLGNLKLSDVIALPAQSWAVNAPRGSSLMYLAEGHIVTLDELLLGLAVPSGNDAAVAVALAIEDSIEAFVRRMNTEARNLGMMNTVFFDTSGYSELNITTARDFASFCRAYISKYPETIARYHSVSSFVYPQLHNIPQEALATFKPITQSATNKLLGTIDGADGLKTGFIPESGYNLAYTAKRGNRRIIAVMLGLPGVGSVQGNRYRLIDSSTITDWAYSSFDLFEVNKHHKLVMQVWKGKKNKLYLTTDFDTDISVPKIAENISQKVEQIFELPSFIEAPVEIGQVCGKLIYKIDNFVLQEVPLIADRSIEKSNFIKNGIDSLAKYFVQ
ncbi:MAG: D-alanyl-D-alanine carboxypeptidase family protein [Treponemataceae bacterium]